ncbi:alpha/beta fold hydrolase [Bacillus testis]|uniref:alpha/beta fold hydrolase n=1 Tax=Bacillus testis TaxID=1622072 RepID=UPI00067EB87A|nr:alpha/beta hydrolase [Bacillus testis]
MPTLKQENGSIYYRVKGEGIPLIFIHPPMLTSANFYYQAEELSGICKVIRFDIRGHGRSSTSKRPITYPLIVEDMRQLLDHLGIEKAYVCGYSTGGSIALEFLLTYPERSYGGIIVSAMPEVNDLYLKQRIAMAIKLANTKSFPLLSLAIAWGNADTTAIFRKMHKESLYGHALNIQQYYRYSMGYNCTERLAAIDLPVLLVYGEKDRSFHSYARLLHKNLPDNQLIFLEKEKHQIPTKAAGKLNNAIRTFIQWQSNRENGEAGIII